MAHPRSLPQQDSQRQQRAAEIIRRALAEVLTETARFEPELEKYMISITAVRMAPDLKLAKVYIMPMVSNQYNPKDVLTALQSVKVKLRHSMSKLVQMKYVPDLKFYWDDSLEQALRIESLFHSERVKRDLRLIDTPAVDDDGNIAD